MMLLEKNPSLPLPSKGLVSSAGKPEGLNFRNRKASEALPAVVQSIVQLPEWAELLML